MSTQTESPNILKTNQQEEVRVPTQTESPNILLIIADDLGLDVVNIIGSGTTRAMQVHTNDGTNDIYGALPNISRFLRNGLYFSQAWAQPACSTTRASIFTGLHPWKNGVGTPPGKLDSKADFKTLPTLLPSNYVSGLFGKWHLGSVAGMWPTDHGWDRHVGTLDGVLQDDKDSTICYEKWYVEDSDSGYIKKTLTTDYPTWRTVNEAAAWINAQSAPWFATIAFHSPHYPYHIPPGGYDVATVGKPAVGKPASDAYMFNVMAQNMDYNIGRLLGTSGLVGGPLYFTGIPENQLSNTIIIFIGDNGSDVAVALEEEKNEIYEGSLRVPMIIADGRAVMNEINGEAITPRYLYASRLNATCPLLAHVVELYKTIVRLADPSANAFPENTDSVDFSDVVTDHMFSLNALTNQKRNFNFSQLYQAGSTKATIRNTAYKLNYRSSKDPEYALYKYSAGEIPYREDDDTADDLFEAALDDLLTGKSSVESENLAALLDELTANYQRDETLTFPDPR